MGLLVVVMLVVAISSNTDVPLTACSAHVQRPFG